jgi:hypothetical protein
MDDLNARMESLEARIGDLVSQMQAQSDQLKAQSDTIAKMAEVIHAWDSVRGFVTTVSILSRVLRWVLWIAVTLGAIYSLVRTGVWKPPIAP